MVTKEQALTATMFHFNGCIRTVGPRGGVTTKIEQWRRSGATQTWKTRPDHFRVPIKFGLKQSHAITEHNAHNFHTEADCPLNASLN